MDDSVLQRAVAAIPKDSIFLIEDIDCAFPSREDADDASYISPYPGMILPGMRAGKGQKSNVTLSGLLNVLDGVGSEEGKLFFATVRYSKMTSLGAFQVDRLFFFFFNRPISSTI